MRTLLTLALLLSLTAAIQARTPQFPRPPQFPEPTSDRAGVCPCSVSGTCPCTPDAHCGCLTVKYPMPFRWVSTNNPQQSALYVGTSQLGNWRHNENAYYRLIEGDAGDVWVRESCPVSAPTRPQAVTAPVPVSLPTYRSTYQYQPLLRSAPVYRGGRACST